MKRYRKGRISVLIVFVIVITFIFCYSLNNEESHATVEGTKMIKTVVIQEGDSVWSIAQENYTELDGDFEDYVDEIKETNNISGNCIKAGMNLAVPYYSIPGGK